MEALISVYGACAIPAEVIMSLGMHAQGRTRGRVRQLPNVAEGFAPDSSGSPSASSEDTSSSLTSPVYGWHCVCAPSS